MNDRITPEHLRDLSQWLSEAGDDIEVCEITISINGATGRADAVLSVAEDDDGMLNIEKRKVEL